MDNNVRGKRNPFNGPLTSKPQTVGNTYGDRRAITKTEGLTRQAPVNRPVDKFNHQKNARKNTELFQPNARYRTAKSVPVGSYKSPVLHRVENGMMPKKKGLSERLLSKEIPLEEKEAKRPSDGAIINFLDYIIKTPEVQSARRIRQEVLRSTRNMGNPVEPK